MISLLQLDGTVFVWINTDCSNPVLDVVMPLFSHLGDSAAVWLWIACIGLIMLFRQAPRFRTGQGGTPRGAMMKKVVLFCLFMALIYGINAGVYGSLKHLVQRPRPFVQQTAIVRVSSAEVMHLQHNGSFPSGHACNAFMIAVLLAGRFRRRRYVIFGAASLVALSRVYLGVHYPSDVIAGACLGSATTWLMLFLRSPRQRC